MYSSSKLTSVSYKSISLCSCELFCSQKNHNSMECSFFFQERAKHDHQEITQQQQEFDKFQVNPVSSLEIKLPEIKLPIFGEFKVEDECKTPTSLEHKIASICPPAPRKAKPIPSKKRKSSLAARRRILLDLSTEVESMFPQVVFADLGNKIKKVRTAA